MSQTVLIVDDEDAIRTVLGHIFRRAGFTVLEAGSGPEALQIVRQQNIDLITMDLAMAQMDGVDTLSVILSETSAATIVISAHISPDLQKELENLGVKHCLSKPFAVDEVLATATAALHRSV